MGPCDVVAVSPPSSSASAIFRRASSKDGFPALDGVTTLYELFEKSVAAHKDLPALGTRAIGQDGAAGPFEWMTYGEAGASVAHIASALAALGVPPQGRVGIYAPNCAEWMIAMQACNRMSYECVPLYDSLGDHAIEYVLGHSQVEAVFVDARKLGKLAASLAALQESGESRVRAVIYWGADKPDDKALKAVAALGVEACAWEEALSAGAEAPVGPVPPSADDYCTIMYTSGTTGDPKGVLLRHSAVVASVRGVWGYCYDIGYRLGTDDALLSYLPLAHIFDRVAEELMLHIGGRIGYFQGDTTKLMDDITALRPTLFIGVPRIFERIESGVMGQVARGGTIPRLLFAAAYQWKLRWLRAGWPSDGASPLFDRLVFGKVKARLGGRVRLIVSGGAPLAPHVEEFLRVAMCAPVAQGYGLTECCAGAAIAVADKWDQFATNGPPLPVVEIRFASVPEMGYDATGPNPVGEVLLRGPCMFDGYYKLPDKTAEVLDADGWFHTGDIGLLAPGGGLKIVDRMKNIFKLSQGEYIAVEKLEGSYLKAAPVEQIWVYGDSFKAKLVAVVVPKKRALEGWAAGAGKSGSFEELCADPAAAAWVVEALGATAKEDRLKGFERVAAVHLEPHAFSVEEELVTPTFKLKRPQLKKKYLPQIERLYAELEAAAPRGEERGG